MIPRAPGRLIVYRLAARLGNSLPFRGKAAASLAGRRRAPEFWSARRQFRSARRPVIWFHAASVGEALVTEPVIRRLRTGLPDAAIVLTYSSPSVAAWGETWGADAVQFAPPETRRGAAEVFDAIRPDLLAFSRSDLWPEMLVAATERNIPVAVIGGTVRPDSARLRWPVRSFLRQLYRDIRFVGAVSAEDAERWLALGAPRNAVMVTGDPRHDQVLERITDLGAVRFLRPWADAGPTLVAGSVEPEDESRILEAFAHVLRSIPAARVVLVPHDPGERTTQRMVASARAAGVSVRLAGQPLEPATRCVVVPTRGLLASLYSVGSLSYVGGGFRRGGLHAVAEPAAFGLPVIMGPEFACSPDAVMMVSTGGAAVMPRAGGRELWASPWIRWLTDPGTRTRAGIAARKTLSHGAAGRTARELLALLSRG